MSKINQGTPMPPFLPAKTEMVRTNKPPSKKHDLRTTKIVKSGGKYHRKRPGEKTIMNAYPTGSSSDGLDVTNRFKPTNKKAQTKKRRTERRRLTKQSGRLL